MLRDRDAIDDEIGELRRDLSLDQWRLSQAEKEAQQAQDSMSATRRCLAELEAATVGHEDLFGSACVVTTKSKRSSP